MNQLDELKEKNKRNANLQTKFTFDKVYRNEFNFMQQETFMMSFAKIESCKKK
jgi:hypothetical protein